MKKVLITGISGFVGQHLAQYLLSQQYEIVGTYHSETGLAKLKDVQDKMQLVQLDLADQKKVSETILSHKLDVIVHLAAQTSPGISLKNPGQTLTNNITAEITILETLKEQQLKNTRLLLVSSAEIYGMVTSDDLPVDENTPLRPATPYAVSKIAQDYLGLQYYLSYGLDIIRVRPFNHIGPGQDDRFVVSSFAKQIAEIEKSDREPILYVGNLEAKRDFTDVRDMVRAYELILEKGTAGDVYNIGSGRSRKISDVLHMLLSLSQKEIKAQQDPERMRPAETPEIVCDSTKFHELTGWQPEIPFDQTIKDTLDYWRKMV